MQSLSLSNMNFVHIFQVCVMFLATVMKCEYVSRRYNVTPSYFITSYKEVVTRASALACIVECTRRYRCGFSAYKNATKECFLHVQSQSAENSIMTGVKVYAQNPWPPCERSSAVNPTTTEVAWNPSGWEGAVRCRADHVYSGDNATIACSPAGAWIADGVCRLAVWRNVPAAMGRFDFPRQLYVGWAMCIRGLACTACSRLTWDLMDAVGNILCHLDVRSGSGFLRQVIFNSKVHGVWGSQTSTSTSSFAPGRPFALEFRVQDTIKLQVVLNGSQLGVHSAPLPFTAMSFFYFIRHSSDASLQLVDLSSAC